MPDARPLLLTVSPRTGLLPEHFARLADWAASLDTPSSATPRSWTT